MVRVALAYVFYWLGDAAYRLDLGRAYQWAMRRAYYLQGDDPRGPWEIVTK